MGWKDALHYLKKNAEKGIADKKGGASNVHQDLHLPLGARIGGIIQLQKTPFIHAISNGSFIEMPIDSQNIIKAISQVNINISGKVYRYYLAVGDGGKKEIFLQVYINSEGEVSDVVYCSQLTRIIPETEEDQKVFMGLSGHGLGDKSYCLWRDQLAELGYAEADLRAAFGGNEAIEFWRDAGDLELDFIQPFVGSETRLDDAEGMQGIKQEIYYMPYRRDIKGGNINDEESKGNTEYLFITTEIVQSQNGDTSKREMHVDFMIGIPVELERINIL